MCCTASSRAARSRYLMCASKPSIAGSSLRNAHQWIRAETEIGAIHFPAGAGTNAFDDRVVPHSAAIQEPRLKQRRWRASRSRSNIGSAISALSA
jgi:hypothetical protein